MSNVTITEKFALCMVKKNKKLYTSYISAFHLTVSMLVEMMFEGCIEITDTNEGKIFKFDDKIKIKLQDKTPKEEYTKIVYDKLKELNKDEISITKALCRISDDKKVIMPIIETLKTKMLKNNLISLEHKKGLFKMKEIIVVNEDKFKEVVAEIRQEVLDKDKLDKEMILLTALLNSTSFIKDIFTKYEKDELKKRLEEIEDTEIYKYILAVQKIITAREATVMID